MTGSGEKAGILEVAASVQAFRAVNPADGRELETEFQSATEAELVERAGRS